MRRSFPAVLALMLALLLEGVASAQITLIPGPATLTPRKPTFLAAADFNKDGFEDVAAINLSSNKVTVLFGTASGSFGSILDFDIGQRMQQIAAGDLNADGNPDIAVVTNFNNSVFIATGNGDGTFNQPKFFPVGKRPVDLSIFNLDNKNGLDIVTVDQNLDKVTVLQNQGGTNRFISIGDFPVGKRPKNIATADFNGDGVDDIAAVNTGTAAADDVSVLINNGVGGFGPPANFVVGANAQDLYIADLNNDGAPDMLVLNGGQVTGRLNTFTVSVLLNQTEVRNGKVVGTGFFVTAVPVTVGCPGTLGGIPIFCHPNRIVAADFDDDGFQDFVISFDTAPQAGSTSPTAGLLSAFQGQGDGSFFFSTQISVGLKPQGLVAVDFNGDTIPDVGVAEEGDGTVRVVYSLPPPKRGPGETCHISRQCDSHFCVDGRCCGSAMCPAGQFCDIPGNLGQCSLPNPNGGPCTDSVQCASQFCVDLFCCSSRVCPAGEFCNTGDCAPPTDIGTQCNDNAQCASGFCTNNICCSQDRCPAGQFCNIPGSEGVCTAPMPNGNQCTLGPQCESKFCVDGACCLTDICPADESCNIPGKEGVCNPRPTPTLTPTRTLTPTVTPTVTPTPTPQPTGAACTEGGQCVSTFCVNNVCCGTASCPTDQFCNAAGKLGQCSSLPNGSNCARDTQCSSGFCTDGVCCGSRTCPAGQFCNVAGQAGQCSALPNGAGCASATQCQSLACTNGVCCTTSSCPTGQSCNIPGKEGGCAAAPTPTPFPSGATCSQGSQCQSGFCTNSVCCSTGSCSSGQFCNVPGNEGHCAALPTPTPKADGDSCSSGSTCGSGFCVDSVCCTTPSCPSGQFCDISGDGTCRLPRIDPGQQCDPTAQDPCALGYLCMPDAAVCCITDTCPDGERCDILGFEGACAPPSLDGDPCEKNTDCESPLQCCLQGQPFCTTGTGTEVCTFPPPATPTLIPTPIATATQGIEHHQTVGGGCSIGDRADAAGAWILVTLPVALWVRRRTVVRVRGRRQ